MIFPSGLEDVQNEAFSHYGALTITVRDASGSEVFQQTIHNRLVDDGENFILQQAFKEGTTVVAENVQVGAICVTDSVTGFAETLDAGTFDTNNNIATVATTGGNCKEATVTLTDDGTTNKATFAAVTFTGGNEIDVSGGAQTIVGIGICQAQAADTLVDDCAPSGILFAVIDTSDVTLASGSTESVDITYTLDLSSSGN